MTDNNEEKRNPDLPEDITLPFFAYGIFKPGQLAYSKIRTHVEKYEDDVEINYLMKTRDGVPILIDRESDYNTTKGSILKFREGHEKTTYEIICKTILRNLYEWKIIKINGKNINILFGVDPSKGSSNIEDSKERVCFDGKNDPLFTKALDLIERNLKSPKNHHAEESFFELQMNYMLLWSAIDRFTSLKYNKPSKSKNNEKFAKERAFREGIKKFENKNHFPVYSTEDLKVHKFNADNPKETIYYYYTFRCNVVHKGKGIINDYEMLETATKELLELFRCILKNAFKEP